VGLLKFPKLWQLDFLTLAGVEKYVREVKEEIEKESKSFLYVCFSWSPNGRSRQSLRSFSKCFRLSKIDEYKMEDRYLKHSLNTIIMEAITRQADTMEWLPVQRIIH
jgi:hypothetical protein